MRPLKLLAVALLLPLGALAATKLEFKDVVVTGQPVFDHNVHHGYAEYRFQVDNRSSQERTVDVELSSSISITTSRMTKRVVAPPSSRLAFSLFANRDKSQHRMRVVVDHRAEKSTMLREENSGFSRNDQKTSLLISKSMNQDDTRARIEKLSGSKNFNRDYTLRRTDLPTAEWSGNWLAYSSFDGIILRADEFSDLPAAARAALRKYTELGGVLSIVGEMDNPFPGGTARDHSRGNNRREYAFGFGLVFIYPSATPPDSVWLKKERTAWDSTKHVFDLNQRPQNTNKKFRVVDTLTIPTRGFLLLVTLFAIIAGPLTIFLLVRANRRIWLLWIIPLESALACGVVLLYSLLSEGVVPTVRTRGITLLDQGRHTAATIGWLGYYCPQRPAKGLFFTDDLEVNAVEQFVWNTPGRAIDWTRGQHLKKGWLDARAPTFFMTRRHAVRRERLEFSINESGQVEVVNGLGAEIAELWYRDADGNDFHASGIQAGQKGTLAPEATPTSKGYKLRGLFTVNHSQLKAVAHPRRYLTAGAYMAKLKGAPFMDHGLGERKVDLTTESLVYGVLPREEQP